MVPEVARRAAPLSGRLLAAMERRMFVAPALRSLVGALPERPDPAGPQAAAVVALVVLNGWLCLGEGALDLFRELDLASDGALSFQPRDERIAVVDQGSAERARLVAESLATKLGFSPGHRTKVAHAVSDCARAVVARTAGILDLRAGLGPPRELLLDLRAEPPRDAARRLELGSAPIWSPRRLERVALRVDVRETSDGAVLLSARFGAAPPPTDLSPPAV